MKHLPIYLVLLLSPLILAAQGQTQNQAPNQVKSGTLTMTDLGTLPGDSCPISMHASQGVWDHTIKVRQGQQEQATQPFGQRIFLTLNDSRPAPIIAATVRVHGLTGKNRILQTTAGPHADGDAVKIMKITFASNSTGGVSSDLDAPGFTSVTSIDLLEVSYDDGQIWRVSGSSVCRVTPDRMMLIANH